MAKDTNSRERTDPLVKTQLPEKMPRQWVRV